MTQFTQSHILFDLDGTLVDTRAAVTGCYTAVFREKLDSKFPPDDFPVAELFAMRPAEVFAIVAPNRIEELHDAYRDTYPRCTGLIKVFAGVRDMILDLRATGRKPSIVTNKGLERTLIDLSVADISPEVFEVIVTAEDTRERKPNPAPILFGMAKTGATVEDSLYVGDGPQDILAARAVGMAVIAVSYGFYPGDLLASHQPDALVDSIDGLAEALGREPARKAAP